MALMNSEIRIYMHTSRVSIVLQPLGVFLVPPPLSFSLLGDSNASPTEGGRHADVRAWLI